ncbi:MAG: D-alanyl-D-alanine carboxypeptidase family protein [Chloroflexota bacterium]
MPLSLIRVLWALVPLASSLLVVSIARSAPPSGPLVSAPEAIIIDGQSGETLYQKSADIERYPASTVKIMTEVVLLNRRLPLQRVVTVSANAAAYGGSTAGLYQGETMTVWNLMHGMLLPSGNDAAVALAEAAAGSTTRFVSWMNGEARHLGLWHTHYSSPNGFDAYGQVTTARDLAALARAAMRKPRFRQLVRTRTWTAWSADHRTVHHWRNTNQLLWQSRRIDGVKTGTTPGAGACLVAADRSRGRYVISVNLGSTEATRFSDGSDLLRYGLQRERVEKR